MKVDNTNAEIQSIIYEHIQIDFTLMFMDGVAHFYNNKFEKKEDI